MIEQSNDLGFWVFACVVIAFSLIFNLIQYTLTAIHKNQIARYRAKLKGKHFHIEKLHKIIRHEKTKNNNSTTD